MAVADERASGVEVVNELLESRPRPNGAALSLSCLWASWLAETFRLPFLEPIAFGPGGNILCSENQTSALGRRETPNNRATVFLQE